MVGVTMTEIVRLYESKINERMFSLEPQTKPFGLEDIGLATKYGLSLQKIQEVGVSVVRYVSDNHVFNWYHDLPVISRTGGLCSFCRDDVVTMNTTRCECVSTLTRSGAFQIRPWQDLDGTLSTDVFAVFMTPIFDAIYHAPGICEEELASKFDHMCSRVVLIEFLRLMETEKIITHERTKYTEQSPIPFAKANKSIIVISYQALPNALEKVTALYKATGNQ